VHSLKIKIKVNYVHSKIGYKVFFLGKRQNTLNKKEIQRLGDIRPDPGKTQMGIHHDKTN